MNKKLIILGTVKRLLQWIKENLLKQRPELFLQDDSVFVAYLNLFLIIFKFIFIKQPTRYFSTNQ